jgi:hypothetical protein
MNDIVQHEQTRVGLGAEEGMRRDSGGEMVWEGDLGNFAAAAGDGWSL